MATSIDELQIEINAQAVKANQAIDTLVRKIDKLTASVGTLDTGKLNSLASSITSIGASMKTIDGAKADGFSTITRNIKSLNKIDSSNLVTISNNVRNISKAFSGMSGMTEAAKNLNELATGIKQLGYKSADKAIGNIPQLAKAVRQLMTELSKAPKVSRNVIDMTNALAKLARTGASSGRAATSISKAFNSIYTSSGKASLGIASIGKRFRSLFSQIMPFIGIWQAFSFAKQAVEISSDLTEVQNVVDVTFGDFKSKIEDLAKVSIPELGMSELTTKQIASRFQAMGTAMGIAQGNMADMSVELTRLTGDMASFYNVEQKAVGEDLEAIFTGQTKPLRQYGLDLTEATLQEWALKNGIDANVNSMSQMEKTMLRYQYVLANTGAAQGDFLRTQDTWANQVRILKQNFEQLASVIGGVFINALKPLVKALNAAMSHIIAFAKVISDALGKIFGWTYEEGGGGIANDFEDAAGSSGDIADNTGKAAKNAKELNKQLQGFDKLNVLQTSNSGTSGNSGSAGGIGGAGGAAADGGQWKKTETKFFESDIDTLYKLGKKISETLIDAMESIDWNKIYEKARGFGKGLASFLNGLFAGHNGKTLFGEVGKTIASALNTAVYSALEFAKEFDFKQFGYNIADGINNFFRTFDFKSLAQTLNKWVDGIKEAFFTAIKNIDWKSVFKGIKDFITELDIDTVGIIVGALIIKKIIKANIAKTALEYFGGKISSKLVGAIAAKIGVDATWGTVGKGIAVKIGTIGKGIAVKIASAISANAPLILKALGTIGLSIAAAIGGWNIGQWLNEKITGEKIDLSFFEQMNEIKNSFSDGSWREAFSLWKDDIETNMIVLAEDESQLLEPVKEKFNEFKDYFANGQFADAISLWKDDIYNAFLDISSYQDEFLQPIKDGFNEFRSYFSDGQFSSAMNLWAEDIGNNLASIKQDFDDWYNNKIAPIFDAKNWTWDGIKQGMKNAFDAALEAVKQVWNSFASWLNEKLKFDIKPINIGGKEIFGGAKIDLGKIPTFETGGYVPAKYSLFMAGENGIPEIAGTVGGKTAVAGGAEITGIRDEIRSASMQEIGLLRQQNALLQGILQKETGISYKDIGKASQRYAQDYYNRTNKNAYQFV